MVQDLVGFFHQVLQYGGVVAAGGEQGANHLAQVVVGWDELDAGDGSPALDGDVPEGGGGVDHHTRLLGGGLEAGVLEEVGDELNGLLPLNGAPGVGQNLLRGKGGVPVLQGHHVAAVGYVAGL